jgi:hypothetical protein
MTSFKIPQLIVFFIIAYRPKETYKEKPISSRNDFFSLIKPALSGLLAYS